MGKRGRLGFEGREEGMGDRLLASVFTQSINNNDNNKKKTIIKNAKVNKKIMIHRREFDDKLTKEFLMIVHCNL